MLNRLIIAEPDEQRRDEWRRVLDGVPGVDVRDLDARSLMLLPGLDAVFMMGMLAHEHFGGRPIPGQSQILSSQGKQGMPQWIVTTAPHAARFERTATGIQIVSAEDVSPAEDTYNVFSKAFESISAFNASGKGQISAFGFAPALLNFRGELRDEIDAVKRAWLGRQEVQN